MPTRFLPAVIAAVVLTPVLLGAAAAGLTGGGGARGAVCAGPSGTASTTATTLPAGVPAESARSGGSPDQVQDDVAARAGGTTGCGDPGAVIARAAGWLTAWDGGPVPYLSSTDPATWLRGYRRDCSGYASMALGLAGPGLDTGGLAAASRPIGKQELSSGDLMINPASGPAGHVVVFDRWTDPSMTHYLGYEQSGDGGTHHRVVPYPYFSGYLMTPFRMHQGTPPPSWTS